MGFDDQFRDVEAKAKVGTVLRRRFLTNLSRSTAWLDRGRIKQIDRGFASFESWRDEVLAEEERDQHKLDRKIVDEEH
ncbi:hypothetical protein, partial [Bradyrhizobium ottawaense]|uniref:hypothetical protein n=1 Tax=Bradyrhizobium ottawaense TaxID=931866 RepID=UPI0030C760C5